MSRESATATELATLINRLQSERQEHLDAIAQIDATFGQFGISSSTRKRRGRPPGSTRRGGRPRKKAARKLARKDGRRKFRRTANESVLTFIKKAGRKGALGAEIAKRWKSEGRGVGLYPTLSKLVKAKKQKRVKVKGGRGSTYTVA